MSPDGEVRLGSAKRRPESVRLDRLPTGPGPVDLLRAFRERLEHDPEGDVLVTGHRDRRTGAAHLQTGYTLAGLDGRVDEVARELGPGVEAGAVHPFVLDDSGDDVLTLLALWRRGVTPAPLNPRLTEAEREAARAGLAGVDPEGAQVILWTSGTSGRPRGVALDLPALVRHVEMVEARLGLGGGDVWLSTLSPAHVGGFMLVVRALLTESLLLAHPVPTPEELAALVEGAVPHPALRGRRVTHLSLVPTQLLRLLERWGDRPAPERLRCVLLGGAHTPAPLLERALAGGWPVALTWGMTEMASQVATATPGEVRAAPGSVGRPLDGVEVAVGEGGALRVRSPAAARLADGTPLVDGDGWYETGDLGRADDDGRLWITGRRSDRIVSGGVTVDAREVEEALRAHPAVREACVVGLPDEEWGERVGAWIVPVEGEFDLEALERWLRDRLAPAKRPRVWAVQDHLPRNANGKADRAFVRSRLAG